VVVLTPRRVAFAAVLAFAEGLPGFLPAEGVSVFAGQGEVGSGCSRDAMWCLLMRNIPLAGFVSVLGGMVTVLLWLMRAIQWRAVGVVVDFTSVLAQRINSGASFLCQDLSTSHSRFENKCSTSQLHPSLQDGGL